MKEKLEERSEGARVRNTEIVHHRAPWSLLFQT